MAPKNLRVYPDVLHTDRNKKGILTFFRRPRFTFRFSILEHVSQFSPHSPQSNSCIDAFTIDPFFTASSEALHFWHMWQGVTPGIEKIPGHFSPTPRRSKEFFTLQQQTSRLMTFAHTKRDGSTLLRAYSYIDFYSSFFIKGEISYEDREQLSLKTNSLYQ